MSDYEMSLIKAVKQKVCRLNLRLTLILLFISFQQQCTMGVISTIVSPYTNRFNFLVYQQPILKMKVHVYLAEAPWRLLFFLLSLYRTLHNFWKMIRFQKWQNSSNILDTDG